jgi:RNA polymerase sigma factor (sigma-70 family)
MAVPRQNILQAIKEYGNQLFGFIRNRVNTQEDAEDILQDVWYQLSRQPEVEAVDSIRGWLYRVAKNRITDTYRKKKNRLIDDEGYLDEEGELHLPGMLLTDEADPETEYLREMFRETLFRALQELPEKQRRVFELNEMEDITLQEIADREGENLKTIISRKRYAVQHLRKRLETLYEDLIDY